MSENRDPLDAGLSAAFGSQPSVLTVLSKKTGDAPRISLREDDTGSGNTPVIDPRSEEVRSIPQGKGNYQLMGELARGGMGVVIKGHDSDLGRDVALKVLHKKLADDPQILQRFVEEAQIGGQLQHPGIVPVYELGLMADERPYFTMKLVKGKTLAALLKNRESVAADRRRILDVFASVCQTVAYAHSRAVIHRDLKPSNVMVGAFGEVQVVDWGLAKVLPREGKDDGRKTKEAHEAHTVLETVRSDPETGSSHSAAGSVMGTPAYMSPEQAGGHVEKLDERSDVFSLGAILCEILTGTPPYTGDFQETVAQAASARLDDALARLDACGAEPELVDLTKQCLMPAQAARPGSAEVVAERIQRHRESVEERARAAEIEVAVQRKAKKLTAALAATVVVATVGLGGGWVWVQKQALERDVAAAQRDRELAAGINGLLGEASVLAEEELFERAIAKADQARAMAAGGDAAEELERRIADVSTAIRQADERASGRDTLLAELFEVGLNPTYGWTSMDREFHAVFSRHGVDVDTLPADEAASALLALGIGSELTTILDRWMVAGHRNDPARAARLVDIAYIVDPHELRNDLRAAVLDRNSAELGNLARLDTTKLQPSTLFLLGMALVDVDAKDEAKRVLREAVALHPTDPYLRPTLLTEFENDRAGAFHGPALIQGVAAFSPPHRLFATRELAREYSRQGQEITARGDEAWGMTYFHEAAANYLAVVAHAPDDAGAHYGLALNRKRTGQWERAIPMYRRAIELAHGSEYWLIWCHINLGQHALERGDLAEARVYHAAATALFDEGLADDEAAEAVANLTRSLEEAENE